MQRTKYEYGYIDVETFERVISPFWGTREEMWCVIFSLMRYRGYGPEEACKFNLHTWDGEKAVLQRQKTKDTSQVVLPEILLRRLEKYFLLNKHRMVNGYFFPADNSKRFYVSPNTANHHWHRMLKMAGITCNRVPDTNLLIPNRGRQLSLLRLYDLRASFGTDIQIETGDPWKTMVALRQHCIDATMSYIRKAAVLKEKELLNKIYS